MDEQKTPTQSDKKVTDEPIFDTENRRIPTASEIFAQKFIDQQNKSKPTRLESIFAWVFRFGFASIFLVNAVYAAVHPEEFTVMLKNNPITNAIGFTELMLKIAMVNDLLLGILLIVGWRQKLVYAWAGAWLIIVAGIKLMNLVV